jgi:hypothetical protein
MTTLVFAPQAAMLGGPGFARVATTRSLRRAILGAR